ncbi:MAG TPA: serine/threonine-protein kinase [Gemmatimonadaceae bacterium]|nr:serine/threonine-protein kinase [Gemmatimonadaceae bacterium]
MFCPECGTWNRALAASCSRCAAVLPEVAGPPTEKPDEEISALRRATGTRYRIIKRLGGGGMATVFRAEQMPLAREVIVKVLHAHLARDSEMTERFRREAEAAARLVHPFICPVLDYGEMGETVYIVMPYLGGGSLADRVQRERSVAPQATAAAAAQVAVALDHAHQRGVVHRDVKPDNILFDEDGNALITDFGIATARFHGRLTASGRAMGTPHYMSPEQAMGKLVDGRSDLYALGVVMYEALVGFPPFDGADAFSVGYKHVHEKPVAIGEIDSRVPEPLGAIVMRCLEKSASERYERGTALADALIAYLAGSEEPAAAHRGALLSRIRTPSLRA